MSEEHKRKISEGLKGHIGYWKDKKLPEETKKKMGKAHEGEKSVNWKGDDVGYCALHNWVRRRLGRPTVCDHCLRTNLSYRSYQWANKSGEYRRELDDWIRLCGECHSKFDKDNGRGVSKLMKNKN